MSVRCALLLRAVNVSGRNRVPMAELRDLLAARTDLEDISTYIASGNVICSVGGELDEARAQVRGLIHEDFAVDTPVIARTHEELVAALAENPLQDAVADKMLHVMFLESEPSVGAERVLRERLQPGEHIAVRGRDLWIDYGTGGVAGTTLTRPVLDRALGVAGTARNLLTLRKLAELTA
ncbi:DUF1697 domain-containing protein [uncultured Microbacterium sp.]|uniref:DUF1697 domain-containing protein n=1 Tax=uncultured Microbacterium sp. TaxID=191216 RepID=UPI002624C52C|nr:DUF1697 domain-containing protein [uncultured Microbacterium sp.]